MNDENAVDLASEIEATADKLTPPAPVTEPGPVTPPPEPEALTVPRPPVIDPDTGKPQKNKDGTVRRQPGRPRKIPTPPPSRRAPVIPAGVPSTVTAQAETPKPGATSTPVDVERVESTADMFTTGIVAMVEPLCVWIGGPKATISDKRAAAFRAALVAYFRARPAMIDYVPPEAGLVVAAVGLVAPAFATEEGRKFAAHVTSKIGISLPGLPQ